MMGFLSFLWRNRIAVVLVLAILGNFINFGVGYWKGKAAGKAQAEAAALEKVTDIQEKKNEILLNRPGDIELLDCLFDHCF